MNEKQPLSLEEAKESNRCRICYRSIKATMQPVGWKDRFDELLYPIYVVLNSGQEFAHKDCLPPEPPKPTQKSKNTSLDYWTHNGKLSHTSDCHFWVAKICDCGLLTRLRAAHEDRDSYPKYSEEVAYHDQRVHALNPFSESMISRFEQLIRQQAVHYQEYPCDECGQIILDYVINDAPSYRNLKDPEEGPMFIADLFNSNKDTPGTTKTYCNNCG